MSDETRPRSAYDADDRREIERHLAYIARRRWTVLVGVGLFIVASMFLFSFMGRGTIVSKMKRASLPEVERLAAANPDDREIQLAAGKREMDDSLFREAYTRMQRLVKKFPDDFDVWLGLGRCAAANNNAFGAIEAYEKAASIDSKKDLPPALLAQTYFEAGLYTDACRQFELLRRFDPHRLDRNNQYGESLIRLGRPKEGLDHLLIVAKEMPMQDATYPPLARTAITLGRQEEAIEAIRNRLKVSATYDYGQVRSSFARIVLSRPLTKSWLESAAEQARKGTGDGIPEYYAVYAMVLRAQGKWSDALAEAQKGLKIDAKYRECLEVAADTASHVGDTAAAQAAKNTLAEIDRDEAEIKQLQKKVEVAPDDRAGYFALAAALGKKDRPARAAEALQQYIRKKGEDAETVALLNEYRKRAIEQLQATTQKPIWRPEYQSER